LNAKSCEDLLLVLKYQLGLEYAHVVVLFGLSSSSGIVFYPVFRPFSSQEVWRSSRAGPTAILVHCTHKTFKIKVFFSIGLPLDYIFLSFWVRSSVGVCQWAMVINSVVLPVFVSPQAGGPASGGEVFPQWQSMHHVISDLFH